MTAAKLTSTPAAVASGASASRRRHVRLPPCPRTSHTLPGHGGRQTQRTMRGGAHGEPGLAPPACRHDDHMRTVSQATILILTEIVPEEERVCVCV